MADVSASNSTTDVKRARTTTAANGDGEAPAAKETAPKPEPPQAPRSAEHQREARQRFASAAPKARVYDVPTPKPRPADAPAPAGSAAPAAPAAPPAQPPDPKAAEYQQKLAEYQGTMAKLPAAQDAYWKTMETERAASRFVSDQPPVAPKAPVNPDGTPAPAAAPKPPAPTPDQLAAQAKAQYGFSPKRPGPGGEAAFRADVDARMKGAGVFTEQRERALKGASSDAQLDTTSPGVGYSQATSAETIQSLAKQKDGVRFGDSLAKSLAAQGQPGAAKAVRMATADAAKAVDAQKTDPDAVKNLAASPRGQAIQALQLDKNIGPALQAQKVIDSPPIPKKGTFLEAAKQEYGFTPSVGNLSGDLGKVADPAARATMIGGLAKKAGVTLPDGSAEQLASVKTRDDLAKAVGGEDNLGKLEGAHNEAVFKKNYADEAKKLVDSSGNPMISAEHLARVYAFETGGNGKYDDQPIRKDGSAMSTALGYAQLMNHNAVGMLGKYGPQFAKELRDSAGQETDPARKAELMNKAGVVERMAADAAKVPDSEDARQVFAKTPAGRAMHAMNLDKDVGPKMQIQKLGDIVRYVDSVAPGTHLEPHQLETLNLAGEKPGMAMLDPKNANYPTANFFSRAGYEGNPTVNQRFAGKDYVDAGGVTRFSLPLRIKEVMDKKIAEPGSQELLAAFGS